MKTLVLLLTCLMSAVLSQALCQTDSVADVFPLSVGNQWRYSYTTYRLEPPQDVVFTDSGLVQYTVIGREVYADSTTWTLTQTRTLRHCQRAFPPMPGFDTCHAILDTTMRLLVERHAGSHQLYVVDADWRDVFPFTPALTDTTAMFRYRHVDSSGMARIRTSHSDPFCAHSFLITMKSGTGVVAIQCSLLRCTNINRTNHMLLNYTDVSAQELRHASAYALHQNYPNPFNPTTEIRYQIAEGSSVKLKVFDILGREVATLVDEEMAAGIHSARWDASDVASGVYLYRLAVRGNKVQTKRMVLLK